MRARILVFQQYAAAGVCAALCVIFPALATAQAAPSTAHSLSPQAEQGQPIDAYIHDAWDSLSRSMNECKSVVDPKLATASILYLPANVPEPPEVAALEKSCKVQVDRLPHRIQHIGDIKPGEIAHFRAPLSPQQVRGSRRPLQRNVRLGQLFIILGLIEDGRTDLAKGMVENFFYEIENYGGILNANRTYYFTRSQPPFLSSMIRAVYDSEVSSGQREQAAQWLAPRLRIRPRAITRCGPLPFHQSRRYRPRPLLRSRRRSCRRDGRRQHLLSRRHSLAALASRGAY